LLGLDGQPLVGSAATDLPASIRGFLEHIAQFEGGPGRTEFFERQGRQGLRLTALPLKPAACGDALAVLIQDLSPTNRIKADIRQLDRLASVGTLAAEMAHEVRNAMVAVRTLVDLLIEKNPEADLSATARREIERIDTIVGQVLNYSRNSPPVFKQASVHTVIEQSLTMMKPRFKGRNITVVSRLEAAPDTVHGDEHHLNQAILNLLLNASDAVNGEGTVSVETDLITGPGDGSVPSASKPQVRIRVQDSGAGIPSESLPHLFEPFFTTKQDGNGLGLAITRRIVHEHRGHISAESPPGRGATFQILLPAA
jgi:signal transduction histidine kinase